MAKDTEDVVTYVIYGTQFVVSRRVQHEAMSYQPLNHTLRAMIPVTFNPLCPIISMAKSIVLSPWLV